MKQTFLIRLEDAQGGVLTFERWQHKKATTCINKMLQMYRTYYSLCARLLSRAATVTCYATPEHGSKRPVWRVTGLEFYRLIMSGERIAAEKISSQ